MAILSAPFQAVSIPFAYNVMLFLGFALSGVTTYILADYLTKNKYAAFIAGIIYAFSAFHMVQAYSHIEWINIEWIPLALYFFIRMLRKEAIYWSAIGLAISLLLTIFMSGYEQGLMAFMMLFFVFLAHLVYKQNRKIILSFAFWKAIGLAAILFIILGSIGFASAISALTQPNSQTTLNYLNDVYHNALWSNDLLSFFLPSYHNGFAYGLASTFYYSIYVGDPTSRVAYIGFVALILALYGLTTSFKKKDITIMFFGVGIIFFLLSLGPFLQVGGSVTGIPGLYSIYHALPLVNYIREPGRFDLIFMLMVAVLAAYGAKDMMAKFKDKKTFGTSTILVATAIITFIIMFESAGMPLSQTFINQTTTYITVPAFYQYLGSHQWMGESIYSIPAVPNQNSQLPAQWTGLATYYTAISKTPLVGGYVTRENLTQQLVLFNIPLTQEVVDLQNATPTPYISPVYQNPTNQTLLSFFNYNTEFVTLQKGAFNSTIDTYIETYLYGTFGNPVYNDGNVIVFQTTNTLENSAYRSFVAYPQLTQWAPFKTLINGTPEQLWDPINPGAIVVYAPFPNNTNVQQALNSKTETMVNATIGFFGVAPSGSGALYIEEETSSGATPIASFNFTTTIQHYSLNVTMVAGAYGNTYLFVPQESQQAAQSNPLGVTDITFSGR
ncbi:MAG: hypothetical protein M1504_03455 [Candidatus Marsarchaeota archaeon]|nr:hypothetical protein [Candidatus Marsarchaeota archaeon]